MHLCTNKIIEEDGNYSLFEKNNLKWNIYIYFFFNENIL